MHKCRQWIFGRCTGQFWMVLVLVLTYLPSPARSSAPAQLCDAAARRAAERTGVPLRVLRAITRTETGRGGTGGLEPWPWTVNMEGKGVWFDTEAQARAYVFRHFNRGARSFDVGCFQLNYKWHGQAFHSLDDMFDPQKNADYAAQFLSRLHEELGDWTRAAGAYHSRTPQHASRYLDRYSEIHAALSGDPALGSTASAMERRNGFPLLTRAGASGGNGSLVPLSSGAGRSLIAPRKDS